ncbi:hypothetical protein FOZ61_003929 [Perkinsus olseni]|uniref:Uncharacterized protein n=1 Tax=Perkinsus olseni TaxID=32597 RepID=A0A7J6LMR4_PEROL|nr:hypothetical protein FOZ61_003929 [Perkinsus olseni]
MRVLDACEHELLNWEVMEILNEERKRLEEDKAAALASSSPSSPGSSEGGGSPRAAVGPVEEEEPSHDKLRMENLFKRLSSYLVDELHTSNLRQDRIPKALDLLNSHGLPHQCSCELLNNTKLCANSDVYVYTAIESVPNVSEETLEAAHNVVKFVLGSDEVKEEDMVGPMGLLEDTEDHQAKRPRRTSNHKYITEIMSDVQGQLGDEQLLEEGVLPSDYHQHTLLPTMVVGFILLWALAEGMAYIWYRRRLALRNATPAVIPVVSSEQRDFVFNHVLDLGQYYPDGVWRLLKGWFYPSIAQQDLRQDNLNEMLAWAFCYKDTADLTASEWRWVEKAKGKIYDKYGYSSKPGRADVKTVRNTIDPIVSNYHPLSFYCGVYLAKAFGAAILRLRGYHHYSSGRVKYWYRSQPALEETLLDQGESSQEVFVFFHGIGIGLVTYLTMLFKLHQPTQFLFEMPWISMNPLAEVIPDDEYAVDVKMALKDRGVTDTQRVCLAGHSFGSLPVVWIKRHCPDVFDRSRVVLVDPVCIYLNLPDVCLNFLYRKPRRFFMRFLRYIASEELGIACSLHRDFFWMQSVIFPEELPEDTTVFLSEYDHVVPVHDVYTGCQRAGVDTRLLKGIDHGWYLGVPEYLREVTKVLNAQ